jgi:pyridoxine 5-phosphate synthase
MEMAATTEMQKIALKVRPDVVSLVPERPEELTTEGGLNVITGRVHLAPFARKLRKTGIRVSIFIDPDVAQIRTAAELGVDLVEINTGRYADLKPGIARDEALAQVIEAAEYGHGLGLEVHAGHGLDYHNVLPIVAIPQISELSIGFSIVARAAIVGLDKAVREMRALVEKR